MWAAFLAIAYKEFLHVWRDKGALRLYFLMQAINMGMLGFIDITVHDLPTVIVDQDDSVESRELVNRIAATGTFGLKYMTTSVDQAREHVHAGRASVAILIPPGYQRDRASAGVAKVMALVDGSDSTTSAQAVAAVDGLASRLNLEAEQEIVNSEVASVIPHSILLFNPQGRTASFMLPALLAVLLMELAFLAAMSLIGERDSGNLERLLMTPLNYNGLILGKLAPYFLLGVVNGVGYLLVIRWIFAVPLRGDLLVLVVGIVLYSFTLLSLGMFLAASSDSGPEAILKINLLYLATMIMSGYLLPIDSLPVLLRPIAHALPASHMIDIMRGACLRGSTLLDLLPHFVYLSVAPIVLTFLAAKRFAAGIIT